MVKRIESPIFFRQRCSLFFVAGYFLLTGCGTTGDVLLPSEEKIHEREQVLIFNRLRYSIVAFGPDENFVLGFSGTEGRRFRKALDKLYSFFGGNTTYCPIITMGSNTGYIRYENREGTFWFDASGDKRKKPFGIVMSDGIRPPKIVWGWDDYLVKAKKYFGIHSYEEFLEKLSDKTDEPEVISQLTMAPLQKKSLYKGVDQAFTSLFLANNKRVFSNGKKKGIRKRTQYNHCREDSTRRVNSSIWYDENGFPEKKVGVTRYPGTESVTYEKSMNGLIIREQHVISSNRKNETTTFMYQYQPDMIIKYREKGNYWIPTIIYQLDHLKRVSWQGAPAEKGGYSYEQKYKYNDQGNHISTLNTVDDKTFWDLFRYDRQGRLILAHYQIGEKGEFKRETKYIKTGYALTFVQHTGKKDTEESPKITKTVYDEHGNRLRMDLYTGNSVCYDYEYL